MGLGPYYGNSAATGTGDGSSKANAFTDLVAFLQTVQADPGATIYLAKTSVMDYAAETIFSANSSGNQSAQRLISLDFSTDQQSDGATLRTTGNGGHNLKFENSWYTEGIKMISGVGATDNAQIRLANGYNSHQKHVRPVLQFASTGASTFSIGETGEATLEIEDPTFKWNNPGSKFVDEARLTITGGGFDPTTVVPTNLIDDRRKAMTFKDFDLSALVGTTLTSNAASSVDVWFTRCKMPSAYTVAPAQSYTNKLRVGIFDSTSDGTIHPDTYLHGSLGSHTSDTGLFVTSMDGAGGIKHSLKVVTGPNVDWARPFECLPISAWNEIVNADITATVHGIINGATLPTDDEVFGRFEFLGNAGSTLGKPVSTRRRATVAAAPLAADTAHWNCATARTNGETVAVGQTRKVASNPGRIFFVTAITTGVLAGAEPAGYASAVDGGSVTDGGATLRAGIRFKIVKALQQPKLKGSYVVTVGVGKVSSTIWFDPKVAIS